MKEVDLYNLEMISPQECNFQMGGLAYDSIPSLELSLQSLIEFIQNPMMVPRSTIYKQKRKFFALVSVSSCLLPPSPTFHNMTPKSLKNSTKKYSSSCFNWRKEWSYIGLSMQLRKQGGKQRKRLGRKPRGRGLQRRKRRRRECWSISNNSGTRC